MPAFILLSRSATPSSASASASIANPIYLAGVIIAVVIVLVIAVWLGLRAYRKRLVAKREEKMGAAFLSVKGLVRDDAITDEKYADWALQRSATQVNSFSRTKIDQTIVLPQKARLPSDSDDSHISFHVVEPQEKQSDTFPTAFAPKPFSFALDPQRTSMLDPGVRNSFMSTSSQSRFSVMSSTSSFESTMTLGTMRKVRQVYDPVLPDELVVHAGEQLTVVQSFDDGWCVVGRENASLVHTAKSLFKPARVDENEVEIGVVPAWCFLKPVKGLRAERPVRSTSLGITVNFDAPGNASRDEMISWSNF